MKTINQIFQYTSEGKGRVKVIVLTLSMLFSIVVVQAQSDTPQYKGDNFSLDGALALFKKAKTVEQFEQMLNDKNNNVNNLDLNGDGKTDYISVNDIKEYNSHVLVLSTAISKDKTQDIATINIERSGSGQANVQIIGDPDLYPANTIAEPSDYNGSIATSSGGNNPSVQNNSNTNDNYNPNGNYNANGNYDVNPNSYVAVNVWGWPLIQYMYNPYYSIWNSPYDWYNLPYWYTPWQPFLYSVFYPRLNVYRPYFHRTNVIRVNYSRNIYNQRRGNIGYRQNFRVQNNPRSNSGSRMGVPRSTAPRTTAPRTTAPRTTAPRASNENRGASRQSSGARNGGERRR